MILNLFQFFILLKFKLKDPINISSNNKIENSNEKLTPKLKTNLEKSSGEKQSSQLKPKFVVKIDERHLSKD